jgi:hypothetical protein
LSLCQRGKEDEHKFPKVKERQMTVWKGSFIMDDLPAFQKDWLLSGHLLSVFSISPKS